MKTEQLIYKDGKFSDLPTLGAEADWILVFGSRLLIENNDIFDQVRAMYPSGYIMGCSSSGEIFSNHVSDNQMSITAIHFEKSHAVFKCFEINKADNYYDVGINMISGLDKVDLKHIFILTEGININGSKLIEGMRSCYKGEIPITGGLAGDGANFVKTAVIANTYAKENIIVLAALYGKIKSGCGSYGGGNNFGIERVVTKATDNILYEIDSKPALDLYKEYLGDSAKELPSSGLRFPLSFRARTQSEGFVLSVQAINEENGSLIFKGDVPQNSYCRMMKSNISNIVESAKIAAELSANMIAAKKVELIIVISCFGRKFILKHRVDEEIEVIREFAGNSALMTGYYSYGEIAPHKKDSLCQMHNQTMTITLLSEED
jgi:hypothetical protein